MRVKKMCLTCGADFEVVLSRRDKAKYCSPECYHEAITGVSTFTPERFWSKVDKSGDCWEWTACKSSAGYGQIRIDGEALLAHRVAWELENGPIPDGLLACHKCDNRSCVRPSHLFLGTYSDNMQDMHNKGRAGIISGVDSPLAALSEKEVLEIRQSGESSRVLAEKYDVSHTTILAVKREERYQNVE